MAYCIQRAVMEATNPSPTNCLNFNVGVLGHIDSGKTSLCKALSTIASTASFDKNPQSQERGITLDLGFSAFCIPAPPHLDHDLLPRNVSYIQYTLVDCPGHASLIRTIISGAQIMDLMFLVVDVTKGIQTQTAECLIIGEITCSQMIVVLNKIDALVADKREASIMKMKTRLEKTLQSTKFSGCPIVAVAAKSGDEENESAGLSELIQVLAQRTFIPKRDPSGPLLFSVDHCFSIRGQGTVMTGTMLSGCARIGGTVEIVSVKESRKIKSMQMFRQPVQQAVQGDRVGICVPNFDAKLLERGFVATPGTLETLHAVIIQVKRISYFKQAIRTRAKFHVTIGHDTVIAKILLFSSVGSESFIWTDEYSFTEEIAALAGSLDATGVFALIELETPVFGRKGQLLIASRLDADIHQNACRLAFYGNILECLSDKDYHSTILPQLKIFKLKEKVGTVERIQDSQSVIVKNMIKKETDATKFEGLKISLSSGETGIIEGAFGKGGKLKVRIPGGLKETTAHALDKPNKKKSVGDESGGHDPALRADGSIEVKLSFKRYMFDARKQMLQI